MFRTKIPSLIVVGLMLAGLLVAASQLPRIRLQNKLETWLAEDDEQRLALRQMESYFPAEERVLVSWDTSSLTDPRSNRLRDVLIQSPYISKVRTAADVVQQITRWKVSEDEAIRRLTGVLIGHRKAEPNAACVLTLSAAGIANPAAAQAAIQAAAAESGIPTDELHVDGALITSLAIDREVIKATWNPVDPLQRPPVFALSALAGILLAFVIMRSVWLGFIVTIAAWFTAIVTIALIPAVGHTMNMVTIVMPSLLLAITISGSIHVVNYWRHAAATGATNPIQEAIRLGWWPCFLANATTAVGLLSLTISRLGPVRDFGIFSTIGTLLSWGVVIVGITAMLRLFSVSPGTSTRKDLNLVWCRIAAWICRYSTAIVAVAIILGFGAGFGLQWLKTEVKVSRYFPEHSRLIRDSRFLEENIGGTSSIDLLVHFGEDYMANRFFLERMALIRDIEDAVRQHPDITGALSLADFQPVNLRPGPHEERSNRMRYVVRSRRTEEEIKTSEVASSADYLAAPKDPNFVWSVGAPLDETWRITAQTAMIRDLDYQALSRDLTRILSEKTGNTAGLWFSVTGSVPVFYRAQTALLESLTYSLAMTFVLIAIAMMFLLRSIPAGLLSSVIGMLPIAVVFGLMSWCGQIMDIGTMLTGSVALGIAVDDMLHLITWFRVAIQEGKTREESVVVAMGHCGTAMLQTSIVIALSLLLLYPAELLLISRFGWVMAALLGAAWLSSVLLLPALLAGPLGWMIADVKGQPRAALPPGPTPLAGR
jgi:predicted RND superfamily exporter protein